MKSIVKLIMAETPKVGKKLTRIGVVILSIVASAQFMESNQIVISIPAEYQGTIDLIKMIVAGLGTFVTGAGISSTKEDPDKITTKNEQKR